jgi:hypothetical protein
VRAGLNLVEDGKDTYAAGTASIGAWDHCANGAFTALCNEWSANNNVEVKIDYITFLGAKLELTAAAEAQAGTGHDILAHPVWNIGVHASKLEPLDGIATELINKYGPISLEFEYLGKIKGTGEEYRPREDAWCTRAARAWTSISYTPASICAIFSLPTNLNGTRRSSIPGTGIRISCLQKNSITPDIRSACRWGRPTTP